MDRASSRRSATPCSWSATATRSRSTSTPTTRSRPPRLFDGTARGLAARRRRHARADGRARRAASATAARRPRLRRARGRLGRRHGRAVRLARRGPARRRPDAQPLHLRPAGRHPRRPGRGGRRAAQLAERDHGRRARRRAVGQDRARGARRAPSRRGSPPRSRSIPTADAAANAAAMDEALAHVRTGAVTEAARDDTGERFRRGEAVGFVDEQLVAWGEPAATLEAVLGALASDAELVTLIAGDGVAARRGRRHRARAGRGRARVLLRRPAQLLVADRRRVGRAERTSTVA